MRDAGPAVEFRRRFAMARSLFFERAEARRAKVVSGAAPENSALSWREESKALRLESFALNPKSEVGRIERSLVLFQALMRE